MMHDRAAIMRRAHVLRKVTRLSISHAMKAAWAEAKAPKAVAISPQRLLLEAAAMGALTIAKKMKDCRVEFAFRVKADVGLRVTPKGEMPPAFTKQGEIGAGFVTGR